MPILLHWARAGKGLVLMGQLGNAWVSCKGGEVLLFKRGLCSGVCLVMGVVVGCFTCEVGS